MSAHHLVFAILASFACLIANIYIYARFFNIILPNHKRLNALICTLAFISCVVFMFLMRSNALPNVVYAVLAAIMGFSFFFFLVAIIYDLCKLLIFIFCPNRAPLSLALLRTYFFDYLNFKEAGFKAPINQSERRNALKIIFNLGFLFIAAACFAKGLYNAMRIPPLNYVKIKNKKGINLRIAMVSDLHLGKNLHAEFLRAVVDKINATKPDVVVIVGDLIDTDISEIDYLNELNRFAAPVFYVSGNHEFYHGAPQIFQALKSTKLKQLHNASAALNKRVNISGLEDLSGAKYNMPPNPAALNIDKSKFNILLTHQPKSAKLFDFSDFDLVLAGHTHAGQIFPFSLVVLAQQGYLYGLYKLAHGGLMYVSSGAGFWGPSIRFLAPSEIAILEIEDVK